MDAFKHSSIIDAVGNTPIIRLNRVAKDIDSEIYVKLNISTQVDRLKIVWESTWQKKLLKMVT